MENKSFAIEGMTCASCAQTVEKAAKKVRGVTQASVNLATEKLSIEYNEPTFSVENLQKAVDNSGYELIAQEGKTQTFAIEGMTCASCAQTIEKAVGKIVKDIFTFPGGRRFHFSDPSGNELAVWSTK